MLKKGSFKLFVFTLGMASTLFAQIQITSLPKTITSSGNYYLAKNLQYLGSTSSAAITINAPNVVLDLKGFSISGKGKSATGSLVTGIKISQADVEIINGSIRNFNGDGVYTDSGRVKIRDLSILNIGESGITSPYNGYNDIRDSRIINAGTYGISAYHSIIKNNIVFNSGSIGINCETDCIISENISNSNTHQGIQGLESLVKDNVAQYNHAEGIVGTITTTIHNQVLNNDGVGIVTDRGSIIGNTVAGPKGIQAFESLVDQNTISSQSQSLDCPNCVYGTNKQ